VAGSAVPLQPAEEVELTDLQRLVEEAGRAGSQRSVEEAGLTGSAAVAVSLVGQSWTLPLHTVSLRGYSIEHLLHARAKDAHHHLLENT
jgi:hypothetical protein